MSLTPIPVVPPLPDGYVARRATMQDAPGAAALQNAVERDDWGDGDDITVDELRAEWVASPNIGERVTLVVSPDGAIVASLTFDDHGDGQFEADGYVHPAHAGLGLGTWLIRESERRAAERRPLLPPGSRPRMRSFTSGSNQGAQRLLGHEGYTPIRHFWRMTIDLDAGILAPAFPDGLRLATCREGIDEREIWAAAEEAFDDHFQVGPRPDFDEWIATRKRHGFDPSLWLVLWDGDEIAGVALGRITGEGIGWVSRLAVRDRWRRRGIGRALLQELFERFRLRGMPAASLGVDSSNGYGATSLYETVGMRVTRNYVLFEKYLEG
jgi:mycothiol synthase